MTTVRLHGTGTPESVQAAYDRLEGLMDAFEVVLTVNELREAERGDPGLAELSLYVAAHDEASLRAQAALDLGADALDALPEREDLPETDWVAHALEGLPAVRVGRMVVHGGHDRGVVRPGDIGLHIEAGLAFGTGHHGTTAACLDALQRLARRRRFTAMLDVGTGSGVLAIALARLLRRPVLATDIDPVATATARDNARLNGVGPLVGFVTAAGLDAPMFRQGWRFDLIVANILAGPLKRLAPQMARAVAPDACLVLSGILNRQAPGVEAVYRNCGMVVTGRLERGDWTTLMLTRRGTRPSRKPGRGRRRARAS